MRLTWKDAAATMLIAAILVPYFGYLARGSMPFIHDARGMAAAALIIGAVTCYAGDLACHGTQVDGANRDDGAARSGGARPGDRGDRDGEWWGSGGIHRLHRGPVGAGHGPARGGHPFPRNDTAGQARAPLIC